MAYYLLSSGNSACLHIQSFWSLYEYSKLKIIHEAMKNILDPIVQPIRNALGGANKPTFTSTLTFLSWIQCTKKRNLASERLGFKVCLFSFQLCPELDKLLHHFHHCKMEVRLVPLR